MAAPQRFAIFAALGPLAGWRRALALDRGAGAPRAVVLSFVPEAVVADATRFAAVVRDADAATKLKHPGALPVLGVETVGETLAVVEPYRPGATLRALLASGGRLPPDVAGRIVADACAAIVHAHSVDTGDGLHLVHGALEAGRVSIGRDGSAAVCGFGMAGFAGVADDVRALGAILHECLTGEPPSDPPRALAAPGIRPPLAAAVSRAIGASPGETFATADALAKAIEAAVPLATHAAVASYAEAILPAGEGKRAELFATLEGVRSPSREDAEMVSEDLIVGTAITPLPPPRLGAGAFVAPRPPPPLTGAAAAVPPLPAAPSQPPATYQEPLARSRPAPDAATTFPAPPPPAQRRSLAILAIAAVCAVAGFGLGFVGSRFAPGAFAKAPPPAVPTTVRTDDLPLPAALLSPPSQKAKASRTPPAGKAPEAVRRGARAQKGPAGAPAEEAPEEEPAAVDASAPAATEAP